MGLAIGLMPTGWLLHPLAVGGRPRNALATLVERIRAFYENNHSTPQKPDN
jgi:hypothetical protein